MIGSHPPTYSPSPKHEPGHGWGSNNSIKSATKDINAREFDTNADFDAHYDRLDEWNLKHRWHTESSGAILAWNFCSII